MFDAGHAGHLFVSTQLADVFVIEPMHNFILGAVKRIVLLIPALFDVTTSERTRKRKRGDDAGITTGTTRKIAERLTPEKCKDLYNSRIKSFMSCGLHASENPNLIKRIVYTPRFLQASEISHLKASDFKFLVQMIQFVIGTGTNDFFIPSWTIKIQQLLRQCNQIGELLYSVSPWNEAKIACLQEILQTFGENMRTCFNDVSPSGVLYIKLHRMAHIVDDIRNFGSPRNYLGDIWELSHQWFVKRIFPRTNGEDERMLQEVLRRELLHYTAMQVERKRCISGSTDDLVDAVEHVPDLMGCKSYSTGSLDGEARLLPSVVISSTFSWRWLSNEGNGVDMAPTVPVSSTVWKALTPLNRVERERNLFAFGKLLAIEFAHVRPAIDHVTFFKEVTTVYGDTYRASRSFRGLARFDVIRTTEGNLGQLLSMFHCSAGDFAVARMLVLDSDGHSPLFPWSAYRLHRIEGHQVNKIINFDQIDFSAKQKPYLVPDFSKTNSGPPRYFDYKWWH
jgi:hypothetical protein